MVKRKVEFEEKCKCGQNIPRGYGYYNLLNSVRCRNCYRLNKKKEVGK